MAFSDDYPTFLLQSSFLYATLYLSELQFNDSTHDYNLDLLGAIRQLGVPTVKQVKHYDKCKCKVIFTWANGDNAGWTLDYYEGEKLVNWYNNWRSEYISSGVN